MRMLFLLALLCLGQSMALAGVVRADGDTLTMRQLWIDMPDSVLPLLGRSARLDACDYLESGMQAEVDNALQGKSLLEVLTPHMVQVKLTPASVWQARLLPLAEGGHVVCVVHTVQGREAHSSLAFYTTRWQRLESQHYSGAVWPHDAVGGWCQLTLADTQPTLTRTIKLIEADANATLRSTQTSQAYRWDGKCFVAHEI